jgi:hypothetical protein
MPTCERCHMNEGTGRNWETVSLPSWQGDVQRDMPLETLCDACNDGQYPYEERTPDGGSIKKCPHDI